MAQAVNGFIPFIEKCPTAFHAVEAVKEILINNGYKQWQEGLPLSQENAMGEKGYFYIRNDSSLIAFSMPKSSYSGMAAGVSDGTGKSSIKGFRIMASHSDSPCFKVKTKPEIKVEDAYVKLNVEKYGGMILSSWLDRPLGIAGRVIVKEDGVFVSKLVDVKQCAVIPNVAIHFNREINKGFEYNPQTDMLPLFSGDKEQKLMEKIADTLGIEADAILGEDLYLYADQKAITVGADQEFLLAPRQDDLGCAYSTLMGFVDTKPSEYISVYCLFNNEEVGSLTRQGADSDFAQRILTEIWNMTGSDKTFEAALADSFLLSADNAHALHPNHPEKSDVTNRPYLNGGIVLKFNGNAHYTTDGYSQAFVTDLCRQCGIAMQTFANRSDLPGGSTLGNIMMAHVSIPSADIGLPQLAMHSAVETAGVKDMDDMVLLSKRFFMHE